jgi:hypothetical protein
MVDFQNYTLTTSQWKSEAEVVKRRDGKTSFWKIFDGYRINKSSQQSRKIKITLWEDLCFCYDSANMIHKLDEIIWILATAAQILRRLRGCTMFARIPMET